MKYEYNSLDSADIWTLDEWGHDGWRVITATYDPNGSFHGILMIRDLPENPHIKPLDPLWRENDYSTI